MASSSSAFVKAAWKTCTAYLLQKRFHYQDDGYQEAIDILNQNGLTRSLGLWAVNTFENFVTTEVSRTLSVVAKTTCSPAVVLETVSNAHTQFLMVKATVESLEVLPDCEGCTRHFLVRSSAIVEELASEQFSRSIYGVLSSLLESYERGENSLDTQRNLCTQLVDLGFSRIVEESISWVVFERIDTQVLKRTKGNLETRALPDLIQWVNAFIDRWIAPVLPPPLKLLKTRASGTTDHGLVPVDAQAKERQIMRWRKRLSFYLHEAVCGVRAKQLLALIEAFPRSLPAVEDLKDCILSTDEKPVVTKMLRDQFKRKMLNAGTLTSDILQQYVNMIRTLRVLDPTGVVLENVSDPVREYLRRRPDTVRCIVNEMTGDGDLYEELERGRPRRGKDDDGDLCMDADDSGAVTRIRDHEDEDCLSIDGDFDADGKVDFELFNQWEPDPIDAPYRDGKWNSGGDAIATLVTIYGSSEQIVNEYKGLLADKLVGNFEMDIQRETRILQLLTERFGKEAMHDCSIMLKDVEESGEALNHASGEHDPQELLDGFEATVISKEFWPKLVDEPKFRLSDKLEKQMETFSGAFETLKDSRKLRWQHGLGVVSVTLHFDDGRTVDAYVTPLQATILSHFAEKKKQDVRELQKLLGLEDENLVRRRVQGLANQGFIRAVDSSNLVYETVEERGDLDAIGADDEGVEQDDEDMKEGKSDDAEMAVYETFILAMLRNLKELPLDKIHSMLKRFIQTPVYDKSQEQLAAFLGHLVNQGKVEVGAGLYRIKK